MFDCCLINVKKSNFILKKKYYRNDWFGIFLKMGEKVNVDSIMLWII